MITLEADGHAVDLFQLIYMRLFPRNWNVENYHTAGNLVVSLCLLPRQFYYASMARSM
jgi:hypothetical protein